MFQRYLVYKYDLFSNVYFPSLADFNAFKPRAESPMTTDIKELETRRVVIKYDN